VLQPGEGLRADELGDLLKVAFANPKKNPPRIKGKNKKIWIMAILESKSPSNFKEAFEQLIKDVQRILKEGMTIQGQYYSPDEIHIELPKPGTKPEDAVTELIAAIPKDPNTSIGAQRALAAGLKRAQIDVWTETAAEDEIQAAADLVASEAATLK
jgi:hypothetical protein